MMRTTAPAGYLPRNQTVRVGPQFPEASLPWIQTS